ncbi:MAG: hypothetical protein ACK5MD_01420 [Flavobacteriales bacterium]
MNKQLQHIKNTWNTPYLFNAKELDKEIELARFADTNKIKQSWRHRIVLLWSEVL